MKNGGQVPKLLDPRLQTVSIPCNNCMECRKQKAMQWRVRLHEEIHHDNQAKFVTLTFNTQALIQLSTEIQQADKTIFGYKLDNAIATLATKRFRERWRKKHKTSPKHWLVTELGHINTEHIHLHGFLWTEKKEEIETIWKYGYVWTGEYVNDKTVSYCVKYVLKQDDQHRHFRPIILCTPGIGRKYLDSIAVHNNTFKGNKTREYYTTKQGIRIPLPRYYRNKIYTEDQRERLWLDKTDAGIRYVLGEAIDTKATDKYLIRALSSAHKKNTRLGYGNAYTNPIQKQKEEERRAELQRKTLENEIRNP